ncbi:MULTISPECIES: addiction module antidote protein [Rhizobium]|uniref:Addiction module antidote protein n=1 Tax=Rhizobium rhododendri TaxID=2506430 RepID=A0ABY8IKN6_9HYPH|nr:MULTISPECIES: addiction module antidote protein [Rhizobium]MBZ5758146.1 putative addiction module antidote protein [Rhizobium sp. VS19-DR96]MBZ5765024.1 putative addiction module antidote protein [Rhizobium sp. VS19-DR129.2]MBZ5772567.1 putative addiction module antidote protein [Rhizobium sp. VS19-DRK62.2]MBZ5782746.1 putative addiction module antidote protein [Rhizobium sp. VS19-DR121]MBZ5800194.1 putative addiction module antidote protein [Rhizobium sp. VS19-DR181]
MTSDTRLFDASEVLDSESAIDEFLAAAFETEDPAFIAKSLGVIAKTRNMSAIARDVGMSRAALYKSLSGKGNPEFATIIKVMKALGLGLAPVSRSNQGAA